MKFSNIAAALTLFASSFTYAAQDLLADGANNAALIETIHEN